MYLCCVASKDEHSVIFTNEVTKKSLGNVRILIEKNSRYT